MARSPPRPTDLAGRNGVTASAHRSDRPETVTHLPSLSTVKWLESVAEAAQLRPWGVSTLRCDGMARRDASGDRLVICSGSDWPNAKDDTSTAQIAQRASNERPSGHPRSMSVQYALPALQSERS